MACNCITEKQLDELFKKYGEKVDLKKMSTPEKVKYFITKTGAILMMIVITPMLFCYVLYKSFSKDKKISLKKFFNLKERSFDEYVEQQYRKQQDI
jgi:hypothetical protein